MKTRPCPHCGAPLPPAPPTTGLRCDQCGREVAPELVVRPRWPIGSGAAGPGERIDTERRWLIAIGAGAAVATLGMATLAAWSLRRPSSPPPPSVSLDRALDLAQSVAGRQGGLLVVVPPPTGFPAFDPAANLPWATALAHSWAPDARLRRIDVERLRPDGTVNTAADAASEVQYRFESPAGIREHAARKAAEVASPFEYWVIVAQGQVWGRKVATPPDEEVPPAPQGLPPLAQTLAAVRLHPRFRERPFYRGALVFLADEGWTWHLAPLSGSGPLLRFRARDGRLYPY